MGGVSFEISRNSAFAMHCYGNSFSSGVTVSWRPFLGTSLDTRTARKYQVFHAQKLNYGPACASSKSVFNAGLISDGLVSSELEFKPSFDDYLKEMDSARADKEKLSSRNVRVKKHAANTENQKREKVMSRKPRLEGVEKSTKLEKLGGHVDKTNELGFAEKNGALQVVETVLGKESSSVGHIKLRPRGAKRREPEYDGEESKLDSAVKQKKEAEVIEDRWLECRINRSKPDSDGSLFKRERRRTGNSKASLNRNSNCGNTIEVEVGHEVQSLKMVGEKDVTTRQICCNSKGKMPMINKTVVSNNGIHNGREKICTKNENVGKENGWENLNLNGSIRCYGYDNLEVERAAFKTFEELNGVVNKPQVSHKETEDRIQRLANSLNGADINMPEWIFSKMMRSAKIKFNDYSIVRVIQRLGKLGNWQRVIQVIEWLQRRERFKSHKLRHIYTAALDALGKARRPIEALNVFHAMLQQLSTYPDLVAYRSIAVTLGQAGHMKELFDVIDIMRLPPKKKFKVGALGNWDPRLEPDVVVYNAVLNACVQQKQWEGAFWVLQQLKKQRQQPSTTTSGLVMEVMFTCGKYDLVHEFFMKVQKFSIPNALTYRVLVNTLWKEGKTDEAILAVQDMERRGVVGSASLYYDLARCLCAAGRCGEALMQIEKICKVANKPLVVTYTGLIQACLESGNIQDGAYIFEKMKDVCSPNLVTCNTMLKAYLEYGMFEEAKELFEKMSENTNHVRRNSDYKVVVIPDIYTFNTMLDACIVEKKWNYFDYAYQKMLYHGYHFNPKRHLRMILEASRAGKEEPIETTWKHLIQTDRIIPATLIKERFCMKLEKDDHVEALRCITSDLSKDMQAFSKLSWLNLLKENAQRFQKDTLVRLMDDVNTLVSKSSLSLPALEALENLMLSWKEICTLTLV
ncbi:pentatricopeptide repeat-containing protein At1g30610, chloroplastic isoform X1 [Prosopis cineraria]|uniref:pentatricopeptide repeat-containing protein At1g30610, chloroplastic isoform X1 n=1 Tax=Prosopis cineraria TaxID=364024 RepID=UPI00241074B6|nr:pentatricopeptide repeat-containing protein At1g30610, chloroplastic isoform X1 [Prosopis cineraria]